MKKLLFILLAAAPVFICADNSFAQTASPTAKILTSVADDSFYYEFAHLVRTSNFANTLTDPAGYTFFAVHNVIFRNMATTKFDSLTNNPVELATVLKAHIVKGKLTKADIIKKLTVGKGTATLTNLLGQPIKLSLSKDNQLMLSDTKGNQAFVLNFDMLDPQGVINGIDNLFVVGK